jgi:transcriptional regulator with XRE-family HTH domain
MNPEGGGPEAAPTTDILDIGVRTYGVREGRKDAPWDFPTRGPSRWYLIFDTETTTDETQRLRIGAYQLRYGDDLREEGIFYNPESLTPAERRVAERYTATKRLKLITLREFMDSVFVRVAYHWQATTVGFNLPFDLSRIAEDHAEARGKMRPGFSFETTAEGHNGPRVRIKHLSRRASLIEFSGRGQRLPRGQRKRKIVAPTRRPAFVDVSTLASALLSQPFSLGRLAKYLNTPHQKLDTDEHGETLTPEYIDYALQDVQVTWECFVELRRRYAEHQLTKTPVHRILSEASLGKGYLREMGIKPWREMQRNFPPPLIGKIMESYYGGRTEVHLRRVATQVLYCDFTSMYPTVSTLMGLWRYVIAKGVTWRDVTKPTRKFLQEVILKDLQRPETWQRLHVIVKVAPDGAVLPVRAKYEYESFGSDKAGKHYTIGLNHLTADQPLWYTLADCIASKLLLGRAPKIIEAIAFEPGEPQDGLKPIAIAGKDDLTVDPLKDDLFKRVIELRMQTEGPERTALKLLANSTGYGIFVQLDVNERSEPTAIRCYPGSGRPFLVDMDKVEEPGEFFHPLLGTLITGAARLMLGIAERLVADARLTWAFCDTDSMAIAKPTGMEEGEFICRAQDVRNWFKHLNPYATDIDLFKLEDANFGIVNGRRTPELEPLYCFAVSSKRYVLFNIDTNGRPIIRKATAHGLGHLLPPYRDEDAPPDLPQPAVPLHDIGVTRWQHDLWHCIVTAALAGNADRPDLSRLPNFDKPAVSQYSATTATLLRWFERHNSRKGYAQQVRPFNFMLMFQPDKLADWKQWRAAVGLDVGNGDPTLPCVIAPYDRDCAKAGARCFDRDSGQPVPTELLKTYHKALAQYHLRPEAKFLNADYLDRGETRRRVVKVASIEHIGKEANRWEEQSYLGIDPAAEIAYGMPPRDQKQKVVRIKYATARFRVSALAREANLSRQHLNSILSAKAAPSAATLNRLMQAATRLELRDAVAVAQTDELFERVKAIGIRKYASLAGIDAGHLTRLINRKRKLTPLIIDKMQHVVAV